MYSYSDLSTEIRERITESLNGRLEVPADWIVTAIVSGHEEECRELSDFVRFNLLANIRNEVRKAINRAKQTDIESADAQLVLPGYQKLQVRYALSRNDRPCFVRLEAMTDEEIVAKANECYRMARGCEKHGDELMDYFQKRASRAIA